MTLFLFRVLPKQYHQQQQKVKQEIKIYESIDIWQVYKAQISYPKIIKACQTWLMLPLAGLMASDSLSPTSLLIHQRKEFLPLCSLVVFRGLSLAGLPLLSISQSGVKVPP